MNILSKKFWLNGRLFIRTTSNNIWRQNLSMSNKHTPIHNIFMKIKNNPKSPRSPNVVLSIGFVGLLMASGVSESGAEKTVEAEQNSKEMRGTPKFQVLDPSKTSWKELGLPDRVVHIKGFNFGLDYSNPQCREAAKSMIASACPIGTKTCIVWDGDELREDSFMWAVQLALSDPEGSSWHGDIELACFKKVNDVDEVISSFKKLCLDSTVTIFTAPQGLSWDMLGMTALMYTGAKYAYCLGGGTTVEEETKRMPHISFKVWPVGRLTHEGRLQECTLINVKDRPNVELKQPESQAIDLRLTYFKGAGRAEAIRLTLFWGGVEFEDLRIDREEFLRLKPSLPAGQLPVLSRNGDVICQSDAILRYAGQLSGLYPKDPWKAAKCDEIMDILQEMMVPVGATFKIQDAEERLKMRKELAETTLPRYFGILDQELSKQGSGYLCGNDVTIADIKAFTLLGLFEGGTVDGIPADIIDKSSFTNLKQHHIKMKTRPEVQAYYGKHKQI